MSVATSDADDWETSANAPVINPQRAAPSPASGSSGGVTDADVDDMDAATASFDNLRLVPPPQAQDGGAFDRADPFQRHQQPSPQHALFDPNGNYAQPVSPATATAAVARFGPLDPVLLAALENSRERLTLLKFEDQIVRFIKNPREMQLNFPPLSSYHRLIIHRLAERCYLEHQTADLNASYGQGYDGNASRVVTLFKTAQTVIPRVLLIDLSAEKQQQAVTPASAPKIMVRKRNVSRGTGNENGGRGQDAKNQQRSIEDRERAYAEARARIFGESSSTTAENGPTSSTAADDSTVASASGPKMGNSIQAAGPDGSRGFGRGGGRGNGSANSSSAAPSRQQQEPTNKAGRGGNSASSSATKPTAATTTATTGNGADHLKSHQNWKESKVLWRNREQELNDPDFTRNHDAYRPSRDQHYGGGNVGGRFGNNGGGNHYYDGPRSYGYQSAAQPPYPGRGRGPPPNEYSRIDPMQRSMQPPPPPPPPTDYYRQHPGQLHPPPPPPGAFHNAYSPHGRGGYGNPAPPAQQQPLRRGSAGPPVGAYNEAFPPLGK